MKTFKLFFNMLGLFAALCCLGPELSYADILLVTTKDLIENSTLYEGRQVVLRGEVIGDIMARVKRDNGVFSAGHTHGAWINIKDQFSGVGVWVGSEQVQKVTHLGSYRSSGDIVEVQGIFKHADAEFGGEFCIRAAELRIIDSGYLLPHQLSEAKVKIVWAMLGIMLILLALRSFLMFKLKKDTENA